MGQVLALGVPVRDLGGKVRAQVAEQENRMGLYINTHPSTPGKEKKKPISVYLDLKSDWFGTRLVLQTPELRDQSCCELGGSGHQAHPCAPPAPLPPSLPWLGC